MCLPILRLTKKKKKKTEIRNKRNRCISRLFPRAKTFYLSMFYFIFTHFEKRLIGKVLFERLKKFPSLCFNVKLLENKKVDIFSTKIKDSLLTILMYLAIHTHIHAYIWEYECICILLIVRISDQFVSEFYTYSSFIYMTCYYVYPALSVPNSMPLRMEQTYFKYFCVRLADTNCSTVGTHLQAFIDKMAIGMCLILKKFIISLQ